MWNECVQGHKVEEPNDHKSSISGPFLLHSSSNSYQSPWSKCICKEKPAAGDQLETLSDSQHIHLGLRPWTPTVYWLHWRTKLMQQRGQVVLCYQASNSQIRVLWSASENKRVVMTISFLNSSANYMALGSSIMSLNDPRFLVRPYVGIIGAWCTLQLLLVGSQIVWTWSLSSHLVASFDPSCKIWEKMWEASHRRQNIPEHLCLQLGWHSRRHPHSETAPAQLFSKVARLRHSGGKSERIQLGALLFGNSTG